MKCSHQTQELFFSLQLETRLRSEGEISEFQKISPELASACAHQKMGEICPAQGDSLDQEPFPSTAHRQGTREHPQNPGAGLGWARDPGTARQQGNAKPGEVSLGTFQFPLGTFQFALGQQNWSSSWGGHPPGHRAQHPPGHRTKNLPGHRTHLDKGSTCPSTHLGTEETWIQDLPGTENSWHSTHLGTAPTCPAAAAAARNPKEQQRPLSTPNPLPPIPAQEPSLGQHPELQGAAPGPVPCSCPSLPKQLCHLQPPPHPSPSSFETSCKIPLSFSLAFDSLPGSRNSSVALNKHPLVFKLTESICDWTKKPQTNRKNPPKLRILSEHSPSHGAVGSTGHCSRINGVIYPLPLHREQPDFQIPSCQLPA